MILRVVMLSDRRDW